MLRRAAGIGRHIASGSVGRSPGELPSRLVGWALLPLGCSIAVASVERVPYGDDTRALGGSAGRWRFIHREWMQPQPEPSLKDALLGFPKHLEQVGRQLATVSVVRMWSHRL